MFNEVLGAVHSIGRVGGSRIVYIVLCVKSSGIVCRNVALIVDLSIVNLRICEVSAVLNIGKSALRSIAELVLFW